MQRFPKIALLHTVPIALCACFLALICLTSVSHASSPPADSVHVCLPFDYEQWRRDHPRPAAKRLANLNVGEPRTVRMIYFLPNDRQPHPHIDAKIDALIKDAQYFYAEVMEKHGFGRKTFTFEADQSGNVVLHHVSGRFDTAHYDENRFQCVDEVSEQFDTSENIYLIVVDLDLDRFGSGGFASMLNYGAGGVAITFALDFSTIAHELGHTFGLDHDGRYDDVKLVYLRPSDFNDISTDMLRSFCAASLLNVSQYFNAGIDQVSPDSRTIINMLPPVASAPDTIRYHFEVTDPDGLYHVQLVQRHGLRILDYKRLDGGSSIVEFIIPTSRMRAETLIYLQVTDVYGNITRRWFSNDITHLLLPPEVVSIQDPILAIALRKALGLAPQDAITQLDMQKLVTFEIHDIDIDLDPEHQGQITDLTGLNFATNLVGVEISSNQISDITPLSGLPLSWVNLNFNQVNDITPLSGLKGLWRLHMSSNQITDVTPLKGLTRLRQLDLPDNQITDISPLVELKNLSSLSLRGNPIENTYPLNELRRWNPNISIDIDISKVPPAPTSDFDGDGTVNVSDFLLFANQFGLSRGDAGYDARYDLDGDGTIGIGDFLIFGEAFGQEGT